MERLSAKIYPKKERTIKIVQFGEGNFLRAFIDWIIQNLNDSGVIDAGVAVVQPVSAGRVADLKEQDGLYTLLLEGIDKGETVKRRQIIDVIDGYYNPYNDYQAYLALAREAAIETVISNTTEAGIAFDPSDTDLTKCPKSFPGKLLAFLYERYKFFKGDKDKGLAIVPCELIDYNGRELKKVLKQLIAINDIESGFEKWLDEACSFTNTLVDRIVPGYPRDQIGQIQSETGYVDTSIVKGEIFHLWVLEKNALVEKRLPADKSGLNVIFADDITPYKQRKVKILNGSHTSLVPIAYLSGLDTVREAVTDEVIGAFLKKEIFTEINPTIDLPADQMNSFAESVLERFQNPFIRHELMSIALNSTTKYKTRLLPTLTDYVEKFGALPKRVVFAYAALIEFFRGKRGADDIRLQDNPEYLDKWKELWTKYASDKLALANEALKFMDMDGIHKDLAKTVAEDLELIEKLGMREAARTLA